MSKSIKPIQVTGSLIEFEPLNKWDNELAKQKLDEIFRKSLLLADAKIGWYKSNGQKKGMASKIIRSISIVFFIASTLMPYLSVLFSNTTMTLTNGKADSMVQVSSDSHTTLFLYLGYILAGVGGGILLFDKYYGFSNSWVRFVLARIDLETMRNSFAENWQILYFNNLPLSPISFSNMLNALLKFQEAFYGTIRSETEVWAKEFQQNLQELASAIKVQGENFKADIEKQQKESAAFATSRETQSSYFSMLPQSEQFNLLKRAIDENRDKWQSTIKNYTGVSIGKKVQNEDQIVVDPGTYCLQFNVTEKNKDITQDNIHAVPPFISSHGYWIPTDVLETGAISSGVFSGQDLPLPKPPGVSIGRQNINAAGTLGMRVELSDGQLYGLSCYHVLFPEELKKGTYEIKRNQTGNIINGNEIISPASIDGNDFSLLGEVSHGLFNNYMDCAFFKTTADDIDKSIYHLSTATAIHDLLTSDEKNLKVKFCGRSSGVVEEGVVFTISNAPTITYFKGADEESFKFSDMILLKIQCAPGDSGSVVLTKDNKLLGMIFAVGTGYAWAISMRGIYNNFPFTVK
jgi:hypothetical protein